MQKFKLDQLVLRGGYVLCKIEKEYKSNGVVMTDPPKGTRFEVVKCDPAILEFHPGIVGSLAMVDEGNYPVEIIEGEKYQYVQIHSIYSYVVPESGSSKDN